VTTIIGAAWPDRRRFLGIAAHAVAFGLIAPTRLIGAGDSWFADGEARFTHPEPRPDVDDERVLEAQDVMGHVSELFDGIRAIPHVADGIGCYCGCGAMPDMRSLLSCYEGAGMAQFCVICEGEGRIAVRMHAEGGSLDEIRAAIDRRYG